MTRLAQRWARIASAAWLLCFVTRAASAHAPIPRRVALSSDASSAALSLPGFGLLLRARPDQPFAYLCDALLGLKPADIVPSLAFLSDGSLLVGSVDGVRIVSASGCPRADVTGELASASVMALALSSVSQTAYALASGSAAGLWRSLDGGKHWELRSKVEESELTSALVVSRSDPDRVYVSVRSASGPLLLASTDGGGSLAKHSQELPLTLLSADGRAPYPLWALSRDSLTVGNRGLAILRAQGPAGPWQPMLRVNYFGGFVVDEKGVIWVGDEIGGIYRSDDGGDSFQNLEMDADVACLAAAGDALWACTPDIPKLPVLQKIAPGQPRMDIVALSAVDQLVTCPELDVAKTCAAAWVEWQRDVRMLPVLGQDAGVSLAQDAGTSDAATADAMTADGMSAEGERDAGSERTEVATEASPAPPARAAHSDCALAPATGTGTHEASLLRALSWLVGWTLVLRRRRRRGMPTCDAC